MTSSPFFQIQPGFSTRLFVFGWLCCWLMPPVLAGNFADDQLKRLAQRLETELAAMDPVDKLLLAEEIYFLGHETGSQDELNGMLARIFEAAEHQELKGELAYFLTQQYRQTRQSEKVAELVQSLGYVPEWQLLGPLSPSDELDLVSLIGADEVKGLTRQVSWHPARAWGKDDYWSEGLGHYGYFSANQAVFPNQLAGLLATTWFYAPARGDYRIGLGWSKDMRVWVNRSQVFRAAFENGNASPDQEVVNVRLKKGWHRLTLYLASASEEPNLGFFARVTDQEGKPLQVEARDSKQVPRRKVKLAKQQEIGLVDIAKQKSMYALAGMLLIKEQPRHPEHGLLVEMFANAFAEQPTRILTEKLLSVTDNPNDRWQYLATFLDHLEKGSVKAQPAFAKAWALTQMGQIALSQDRFWEARQYSKRALASHPDYWPAAVLDNNALSALGLDGVALNRTLALNKHYPNVPWLMMDLADLYTGMFFVSEAEQWVDKVLALRFHHRKFTNRKIQAFKSRGDLEGLEALYRDIRRDSPYSVSAALTYAEFLSGNRRHEEARRLLATLLDDMPNNPDLLQGMGEARLRAGEDDALPFLERALALRPQNPALENLIRLSQAERQVFYKPYRLEKAPEVPVLEVSDIVMNLDNKVVKVAPNGQSSLYRQMEWEVITEQGAQNLPGHSFSYSPLRERAELIKAEVYRGDQTILVTTTGRSRISDPEYRMYYDVVAYQVRFPTLQVGDRVRLEYRIDDINNTNIFGDYFGDLHVFSNSYPTKRIAYTLIMPKDRPIYTHVEKMDPEYTTREDGENKVYRWVLDQISPYETESRMPGLQAYLPYLGISTFDNWNTMAKWYADLIRNQLELDSETKQIVAEITKDTKTNLEKVKAIHEYVVTHTRYVALEFGIHGYKPYEVNQVCSRQFGDCKDKASLMVAMMLEAGVEANIVICRTSDRGDIHAYPAMLSYFNHAIAYVPEFDLYLDGTAEFSGIYELPEMDQGGLALIVDKQGNGRLTTIPRQDDTLTEYDLVLNVTTEGTAQVEGSLHYRGSVTPDVRQYLSIDTKLGQNLQTILSGMMPGLEVLQADREGTRLNDPITLHFKGETERLMAPQSNGFKLPLEILNGRLVQRYAANTKRKFPLDFGVAKTRKVALLLNAPDGFNFGAIPESLDVENDDFAVSILFDRGPDASLKVNYQVKFKNHRVSPDNYAALRELMQQHDRILDQSIQLVSE
ncbi:DUF3857 domain-containing protein [Acanthopleuribacter pedis]|uniref:DUF3857 domain-containing protein n=1 Tax=Acanthopleuribacter pedis TaxID=442870 RepID=A0A8J7Q1R2_9BACT|nr:DUF3857 domain-containing protein [Acanthopleuribacter pedis]MBO1316857.1 DUF3857 domain-containing protein [Acanthopleuribacter pedis]